MTAGELYAAAGPVVATMMLVFTPVGILATFLAVARWLNGEELLP